eukprot:6472735-Amphidinium_carterae.1
MPTSRAENCEKRFVNSSGPFAPSAIKVAPATPGLPNLAATRTWTWAAKGMTTQRSSSRAFSATCSRYCPSCP